MRKFIWLFLLLQVPFVGLFAQESVAPAPVTENALLWQITGKDLSTTSYLYGTIHMIGKEDFIMTEATKKAFKEAELVTFEINMDEMTNLGTQFSALMKAFMDDGVTLKDLITEEEYKLVDDHFSKMGLPLVFLERIKPMFLTVFASGDVDPMQGLSGGGDVMSYEMEFASMARQQEKTMGGLETVDFQMSLFDSIPYKAQAQMLVESIQEPEDGADDQMLQLAKIYKSQNLEAMQQMISNEGSEFAAYEELLLVKRNENWIPLMEGMMSKQPTFFAVGAGHLGGDRGVVNLLRQEGYTLTPIDAGKELE
jgi:uncharacterized protein YbaP (TraB family)